jgi:HlyD family secretion protein
LEAQLAQARANLESARARVRSADSSVLSADASVEAAQANLDRAGAGLRDAQRSYDLAKELIEAGVKPRRDLDPAQGAVAQAAAQRQQALAQLNQAKAQAQSARSQLDQSRAEAQQSAAAVEIVEVNLDRSVIRAPIDGTVIARNVNVGQTVSASLQAPTLFLIANDLARMQVLADIDEADVGQLRPDSAVTFTVDAFPQDTFSGRISQIRLAPQTVQNVVTYTAVVAVDNPDLKLRPGMTATMTATVAERKDVLMVSNAALRFRPQTPPVVWLALGEGLSPVRVQTGMTDGISTEVIRGELREGDPVAVPAEIMSKSGPISRSPFSPGSKGSAGGRRR